MTASTDDFSADELAILADLDIDMDQQADEGEPPTDSEQATADEAQSSDSNKPESTAAKTDEQAAEEDPPASRSALRAARRSERNARAELERLRAEIDELKSKSPAIEPQEEDPEVAELLEEFPAAAALIKREREARARAEQEAAALRQAGKPEPESEFQPVTFDEAVQDAIDAVPELATWHSSAKHQTEFDLAVAADALLQRLPAWRDKPLPERFAEAVRRVKADISPPAAEPQEPRREAARKAIAQATRQLPETLSDLGGASNTQQPDTVARYAKMSDDDIFADLARGG